MVSNYRDGRLNKRHLFLGSALVPIIFLFCFGVSSNEQETQKIICMGSPVPPGYVVVGCTRLIDCPPPSTFPSDNNALIIKKPGTSESVCFGSPIPDGYVVVAIGVSRSCCPAPTRPNDNNVKVIKKPGDQELACIGSPIPPGYEIVPNSAGHCRDCGGPERDNNCILIRKIKS